MKAVIIYYPDKLARETDNADGGIFNNISYEDLVRDYGIEEDNILCYIPFKVSGKTYAQRKADLEAKAIDWSNRQGDYPAWSYGELTEIYDFFEVNSKRYGLLKEFRENAIC